MNRSPRARAALLCAAGLAAVSYANASEPTHDSAEPALWEEVVSVASYTPRPIREVGSAVTVFGAEDLAVRQTQVASDLLREVPGFAVNRTGPVGALTQVRVRGAEGNHTLVLIDGIEANDPAFGFEFDLGNLLSWDLERIEVLRGPQSAFYGSEAIGGVISLHTRTPEPGFSAGAQLQGGSFGTSEVGGVVGGGSERLRGLLSVNRFDTDGVSASAVQEEDDGYRNQTVHGRLDWQVSEAVGARLVLRRVDNDVDSDRLDFDFPATATQGLVVDADLHSESRQRYALLELKARLLDERWQHRLAYAVTDTEADNFDGGAFTGGNEGERRKLEYHNTLAFEGNRLDQWLSLGLQHEELEFANRLVGLPAANQRQDDEQRSVIAEYAVVFDEVTSLSASVRYDDNDRFDDASTVRLTSSHLFRASGTRLHGSYGQGITNPGFFELFGFIPDSFIGNPELEPERSDAWDLGVAQAFFDGALLVDLTWFDADLDDEIITVFTPAFESTTVNQAGRSERQGLEAVLEAQLGTDWSLRTSYSWLDADDPDGEPELRRPEHTASLNINRQFLGGRGNLNLGLLYNGEQEDSEFVNATPQTRAVLDDYLLVNLAGRFALTESLDLFARAENLFDEDYTEVFGYRSPGRGFHIGVRARLTGG